MGCLRLLSAVQTLTGSDRPDSMFRSNPPNSALKRYAILDFRFWIWVREWGGAIARYTATQSN
ncbi:hypothetical protein H6G00_29340 [Leptolyngbya sp. FACHB-541]|uniref:hypothetical protein n=1 Tax=Leptolyngbya sp. FACHB-541 TaxID=2692810 RepID=UPI00168566C7|nr:hypothetical protein [Leptolyngbya sp. FACHB-541]MBD2000664.1 hypothetical protein [Leptolyngbya sp. FACHB-541]